MLFAETRNRPCVYTYGIYKRLFFASGSRKRRHNEVYLFVSLHLGWKNFQRKRYVPAALTDTQQSSVQIRLFRETRCDTREHVCCSSQSGTSRCKSQRWRVTEEGDDDSTVGDCVVQSNSHGKTAAHNRHSSIEETRWSVGGPVGDVSLLFACYSLRPRVLFARGDQSYWYTTLRYYII